MTNQVQNPNDQKIYDLEADCAESKRDFRHKIALCRKEAKESMHWLRMIAKANPNRAEECRKLWKEARELVLIFSSILKDEKDRNKKKSKQNKKK